MVCVASVVDQTDASATIAPTDRSMPPPVITKVIPTDTTPMTAASRRMRERVVDAGELLAGGGDADQAEDEQGDDEAEVAAHRGAHQATEEAVLRARCRRAWAGPDHRRSWHGASAPRSCRTSFHDQVEDPVLVDLFGRSFVDDPPFADDQDPVGETEHLLHLARHHDDGDAARGQGPDQGVDLAAGADVDTAGGLVEQQHPAVAQQPAGQHDLLLVAAGQGAHRAVDAGRADVERLR